jgi:uncharacterized repeat protein (TIGR03803 family)
MLGIDGKRNCALRAPGIAALWAVLAAAAGGGASAAPVETVLYSFAGGANDGMDPSAGLIADSQGNLYGTTQFGGGSGCSASGPGAEPGSPKLIGCGIVFELTPTISGGWTETVLYHFCTLANCSDGSRPFAGLIADGKGNLYGTTSAGGGSGCSAMGPGGCGTVFELTPASGGGWTETVLRAFTNSPSDGALPLAGLIADSQGNLYGTTSAGGANGYGTVFELTPGGIETVLYNFCFVANCNNGVYPQAGLLADSKGNLYGTTLEGGTSGYGTVFELSPPAIVGGAWSITVLHAFTEKGSDGSHPLAGLIADTSGNLYGTTYNGGNAGGYGTVFELSPPAIAGGAWSETLPHIFTGGSDGSVPHAGLIADTSGNLYGTTQLGGGTRHAGTVFELTPATGGGWTKTVLYNFCILTPCDDGGIPLAGLIADSKGNLYGTNSIGGTLDSGTVFELTTGTGFVPPVPFAAFTAQLLIRFGQTPNTDLFELSSNFTLGSASNGINPPAETVTLQIGIFTATIPPFSFTGAGSFSFLGGINGVNLTVGISPTGTKQYALTAVAQNASLTGTVNPVPVTLTIGADTGRVSVTAAIEQ